MNSLTLNECLEHVIDRRGVTPKKLGSEWKESGYKVLSANNVKSTGLINENSIRYVDGETYQKWMKVPLRKGDLLLTSEAPAGEVYYWDSEEEVVVGQRLYGLRANAKVDSLYLKYYLQSPIGRYEISKHSTGSTVFGISARTFDLIKIFMPDIGLQKKIGNLLYNLDKKIYNNHLTVKTLDQVKRLVFQYWFLQYEFPDDENQPYKSNGGSMVWNDRLGRTIPQGWGVDLLGNHIVVERGISYSSEDLIDDGIPMINLNSFNIDCTYKGGGIKSYSGNYSKNKTVKPYDLLMCVTQQTAIDLVNDTDVIGKTILVPDIFEQDVVISMDIVKLIVDECYGQYYLNMLFNAKFFHTYISGFATGTKIKHLNIQGVMDYMSEVPDKKILNKFNRLINTIENQKSTIIKENQELSLTRDFMIELFMNGQISIKDI